MNLDEKSQRIRMGLRRDGIAILLYVIVTIGLTWPLAAKFGTGWLAIRDDDTYVKLWDQWWLSHFWTTGQSFFYTNDLFYPQGLNLAFHSISWTVTPIALLLTAVMSHIDAYNATILIALFTTAYAAYLLIYYLLTDRTSAWIGGFIYSFAPYHMSHTGGHPDLVHLAPIPLAVLFMMIAVRNGRKQWAAIGAGIMIGIATLNSLYIMVFAILTIVPIAVFLALEQGRWRTKPFWREMVIIGAVAGSILVVRLWPVYQDRGALSYVIDSKYIADTGQTDPVSMITPSHFNPLFAPYVSKIALQFGMNKKWPAYLGIIPLTLTFFAAIWKKERQRVAVWLIMGLQFFLFTLGPNLRFNGIVFPDIKLPAGYLAWFPPIRAVGRPDFFMLGLLLPLAVCAAFGLQRIFLMINQSKNKAFIKPLFTMLLATLLIVEYWNGPYPGQIINESPFYTQLGTQEETFALIELPMGRSESKYYVQSQITHQKPIVEGLSARTPLGTYHYIDTNPLLFSWRQGLSLDCEVMLPSEMQTAVNQLITDNFRYIIVHHADTQVAPIYLSYFENIDPAYQDHLLTAYLVEDLQTHPFCYDP